MSNSLEVYKDNFFVKIFNGIKNLFFKKSSMVYEFNRNTPSYVIAIENNPEIIYSYSIEQLDKVLEFYEDEIQRKKSLLEEY